MMMMKRKENRIRYCSYERNFECLGEKSGLSNTYCVFRGKEEVCMLNYLGREKNSKETITYCVLGDN